MNFKTVLQRLTEGSDTELEKIFTDGNVLYSPKSIGIDSFKDAKYFGFTKNDNGEWIATKQNAKGKVFDVITKEEWHNIVKSKKTTPEMVYGGKENMKNGRGLGT